MSEVRTLRLGLSLVGEAPGSSDWRQLETVTQLRAQEARVYTNEWMEVQWDWSLCTNVAFMITEMMDSLGGEIRV